MIVNIFFYLNSRALVSTYIVNPIEPNQILSTLKGQRYELQNFVKKKIGIDNLTALNTANYISSNLFASIIRFTQNNKTYRYSFSEELNLNDKEKKTLNLVLKNISLEGAYFLNPSFLSTVELKFYNLKKEEQLIFDKYINYIVTKELENFMNNDSIIFSLNDYLTNKVNSTNEILTEYYKFINLISLKVNTWYMYGFSINDVKELQIEIRDLSRYIGSYFGNKNIQNFNKEIFKKKAEYVNNWVLENRSRFIVPIHQSVINEILSNEKIDDFFNIWEYNIMSLKIKTSFNFTKDNFDEQTIRSNILNNYEFVEKKFNLKEFISINIFSLIFAFVTFSILKNFFKK